MKKSLMIVASLALTTAFTVNAAETGGGCGLGAMVMDGKSGKGPQIAAAILNNLVIPNTFFMTTGGGLMGCDPTHTVQREEAKKIFVASNMDKLTIDAAKGQGDHLEALAYLIGVENQDLAAFQKLSQSRFDSVFDADQPEQILAALDQAMLSDSALAKYVN